MVLIKSNINHQIYIMNHLDKLIFIAFIELFDYSFGQNYRKFNIRSYIPTSFI